MQVVLVMFRSDGERRSFSVTRDIAVIGRREDCDLRIPLPDVSRKHCRLIRDGEGIRLEDLGSSNGTYLNGQRIQEAMIAAGDTIQVGPVIFCVQIDGLPAEEDMAPIFPAAAEAPLEDENTMAAAAVQADSATDEYAPSAQEAALEELPADEVELEAADEPQATVPTADNQATDSGTFSLEDSQSAESVAMEEDVPLSVPPPVPSRPAAPVAEQEPLELEPGPPQTEELAAEEEPAAEIELTDDVLDFDITADDEQSPNDTGTIDGDIGDVHADSQDSHH